MFIMWHSHIKDFHFKYTLNNFIVSCFHQNLLFKVHSALMQIMHISGENPPLFSFDSKNLSYNETLKAN